MADISYTFNFKGRSPINHYIIRTPAPFLFYDNDLLPGFRFAASGVSFWGHEDSSVVGLNLVKQFRSLGQVFLGLPGDVFLHLLFV